MLINQIIKFKIKHLKRNNYHVAKLLGTTCTRPFAANWALLTCQWPQSGPDPHPGHLERAEVPDQEKMGLLWRPWGPWGHRTTVPPALAWCTRSSFLCLFEFRFFRSVRIIAGPGGEIGPLPRPNECGRTTGEKSQIGRMLYACVYVSFLIPFASFSVYSTRPGSEHSPTQNPCRAHHCKIANAHLSHTLPLATSLAGGR